MLIYTMQHIAISKGVPTYVSRVNRKADLNMVTRLRFELRTTRFGERDES